MGFEPTTTCLGSRDSTTELHPHVLTIRTFSIEWIRRQGNADCHTTCDGSVNLPSKIFCDYVRLSLDA